MTETVSVIPTGGTTAIDLADLAADVIALQASVPPAFSMSTLVAGAVAFASCTVSLSRAGPFTAVMLTPDPTSYAAGSFGSVFLPGDAEVGDKIEVHCSTGHASNGVDSINPPTFWTHTGQTICGFTNNGFGKFHVVFRMVSATDWHPLSSSASWDW